MRRFRDLFKGIEVDIIAHQNEVFRKDFISKCTKFRRKLQIYSDLPKKLLTQNSVFWTVKCSRVIIADFHMCLFIVKMFVEFIDKTRGSRSPSRKKVPVTFSKLQTLFSTNFCSHALFSNREILI